MVWEIELLFVPYVVGNECLFLLRAKVRKKPVGKFMTFVEQLNAKYQVLYQYRYFCFNEKLG